MRRLTIAVSLTVLLSSLAAARDWNLEFLDYRYLSGSYYDLDIAEGYLWMAAKRGIEVYDIADPQAPELVSTLPTPGLANGVFYKDGVLYVGDVYDFFIVDVSDPLAPAPLAMYDSGEQGYPERVRVRGGYAYVAAYDAGLQIFDVSDPTDPQLVGQGPAEGFCWNLALSGNLAFVVATFSLETYDISDPANPLHLSSFPKMFSFGVEARGSTVYLAYIDGFDIIDMSDPVNPVVIGTSGITGSNSGEALALQGDIAYIAHGNYIDVIDFSDPTYPEQVGFYYTRAHPRGLRAYGDTLYVIEDDRGFEVLDISDPTLPVHVAMMSPYSAGHPETVLIDGDRLYLAQGSDGVRIFDISDPENYVELGWWNTPGTAQNLRLYGDLLYVGDRTRLQIGDVSDPTNPHQIGSYRSTGNPWEAVVSGNLAYMSDVYGVHVLDVSDPTSPTRISSLFLSHDGSAYGLEIRDNLLYLAASHGGFWVIDASNPERLNPMARIPDDNSKSYYDLALKGNTAYLMASSDQIDIYDITNPAAPTLVREYELPGSMATVNLFGDYLIVAANTDGLYILDVSSPRDPIIVAQADTSGYVSGAAPSGDILFVGDYYSFATYRWNQEAADSTPPVTVITNPPPGEHVEGRSVHIAGTASDSQSGVRLVEISLDDGETWQPASGATSWRFDYRPDSDGTQHVIARATDNAGNVETNPPSRDFEFRAYRPRILAAGLWNTRLGPDPSLLTIVALVDDPQSANFIDTVELLVDGQPTGITLEARSQPGGNSVWFEVQLPWSGSGGASGVFPFQLQALDTDGVPSDPWPQLSVR
jgi:hypothetical protein